MLKSDLPKADLPKADLPKMAKHQCHLCRLLWRFFILPLLALFVLFHVLVASLLVAWRFYPVNHSMFMLTHRLSGGEVWQTWVDYEQIAQHVKRAAVASEDATFLTHNGFDMKGIDMAIKANQASGAITVGGSTITQQLAKNLFLSVHRSYLRKAEEAIITLMIEQIWDKQHILLVYLNVVEFGNGIYGIEAASRHYYQKSASQLNKSESALLIAMLPNPKFYEKNQQNRRLQNKKNIILKRMPLAQIP